MTELAVSMSTQRFENQQVQRERRRVVRRPLNLRVDISDVDGLVRSFTGKNIGLGGVFFSSDYSVFQPKEIIKPILFLNYNGLYKSCRIDVQVMHTNEDGVGVCFYKHDSRLFRYIYKMMYEPVHQVTSIPTRSFDH